MPRSNKHLLSSHSIDCIVEIRSKCTLDGDVFSNDLYPYLVHGNGSSIAINRGLDIGLEILVYL